MIRLLTSLTLALAFATPAGAQQTASFDAVAAAPNSHQVLLENESVRVLRVTIEPGATEPVHDHAWPSIMYFEKAQAITYITYELKDGFPVEARRIDAPAEALTGAVSSPPEGLHAVQNRGTETFTALRVEFKPVVRVPMRTPPTFETGWLASSPFLTPLGGNGVATLHLPTTAGEVSSSKKLNRDCVWEAVNPRRSSAL